MTPTLAENSPIEDLDELTSATSSDVVCDLKGKEFGKISVLWTKIALFETFAYNSSSAVSSSSEDAFQIWCDKVNQSISFGTVDVSSDRSVSLRFSSIFVLFISWPGVYCQ